ncbi:NAD-P-binding protein [Trametopsis cervina]|nr:NAD-P-binding protein [Trametopsis cervina]
MSGYKTFAVVGAGTLGAPVIEELLKAQAAGKISSVGLVTRSSTHPLSAKGVKILTVNYEDPSSLQTALSGVDVVLSTVGAEALALQSKLAQAAVKTGVKLFVPSEFGNPTESDIPGPLGLKYQFRQELRKLGLPYTAIYTGLFTNFIVSLPPIGWDLKNGKITIFGHGEAKNTWTDIPDIARYIAHVFTEVPREKLEWQTLRIQGDLTSFNEIHAAYEARTGKKVEVTRVSHEDLKARVDNNPDDFLGWLLLQWDGGAANVGQSGPLALDLFPDWNPKKVVDVIA